MTKTVALISGGLDSTVLLYDLLARGHRVNALFVDYGQRHICEKDAAEAVCRSVGIQLEIADLKGITSLISSSVLTGTGDVPEGNYDDENMKATVVPNRNMIMLSVAAGYAINLGCEYIAYAAHAGDHAIYPDCRPEFTDALGKAIGLADWKKLSLFCPFVENSKTYLVRLGHELGVPFELTWSCYKGGERHCGKCGTCVERAEAFADAGVPDPTEYLE